MQWPGQPWDGSPLDGRSIIVYPEQGLGDTIHFVRYVPLLAGAGGRVLLASPPQLRALLLESFKDVATLLTNGDPMPQADLHCSLVSLPLRMGTTLETIPAAVPYLRVDPGRVEVWRERVNAASPAKQQHQLKVGLCWAGNAGHFNDRNRSIALSALAPLASLHGAGFFSIQKGERAAEGRACPWLIDLTAGISDFSDTAALIENLDLVIAVDTAVAHLAGAVARPVWTLVPRVGDWRWLSEREDSPWYPTMRLFRQREAGWDRVIQELVKVLAQRMSKK
jgi:hypothetical protein